MMYNLLVQQPDPLIVVTCIVSIWQRHYVN